MIENWNMALSVLSFHYQSTNSVVFIYFITHSDIFLNIVFKQIQDIIFNSNRYYVMHALLVISKIATTKCRTRNTKI
jgi:hypothetical protein